MADEECKKLGKRVWLRVEATEFSGGILVLWNKEDNMLRVVHTQRQFVHFSLLTSGGNPWKLTIVYLSPNSTIRQSLWRDLKQLQIALPWLLIADFSVDIHGHERSSGRGGSPSFVDMVQGGHLLDLGFFGPNFT